MREDIFAGLRVFFESQPAVEAAAIFGSFARGEERPDAEIDILVAGDLSWLKLNVQLRPLARAIGHPIYLNVFNRDNLTSWERSDGEMHSIESSPFIPLKGTLPQTPSSP
jgi:predicted nucleotidyltransferase